MYVVSVKTSKIKVITALIAALVFVALGIVYCVQKRASTNEKENNEIELRAETPQQRAAFLAQFGWTIEDEPTEVKEVVIPEEFDEVYEKYNALQKEQGFDLATYRGQRVKSWTYCVLNYPGYENDHDHVRAHLLVCDGLVIGGDVSSVELDGFMQTFEMPQTPASIADKEILQPVDQP